MRTIVNYILILAAALSLFSCKKDAEQFDLQPGTFTTNALKASATTVVLTPAKENDTAISLSMDGCCFWQTSRR